MLKAAIRHPKEVATIFPTSPALSRSLLEGHDFQSARQVVELGPGTGAITRPLRKRLCAETQYLGVELSPRLAKGLSDSFQGLEFVNDSAQNLPRILGGRKADVIVSSIPWTLIPPENQNEMMASIVSTLQSSGTFSTYVCINAAWYPSAKNLRILLQKHFRHVQRRPVVWANLPPAFVYFCEKRLDS